MPFVGGGADNSFDPFALLQWLTTQRERQGQRAIDQAEPGSTVESAGLDPKTFAALYGKRTPYDPKRVVKAETSEHLLNRAGIAYIQSLSPEQAADIGATAINNQLGTPGQTTVAGAEAARQAGATKSKVALTQAKTADVSSTDVFQRTVEGIKSWSKAPSIVQDTLNQKLAMGSSVDEVEKSRNEVTLANSAIKQAILAQTDPKHPIHAFLKANSLDLNTVLAGTAMGIQTMFGDYARYQQNYSLANKEQSNILLRMYTDTAKEMSQKVFANKISPGQVMAIMKSREDGTALPKGMDAAASVYDRAVQANFDANMQEFLNKGDPYLASLHDQIKLLEKQTDPGTLSSVADLIRKAAGYSATMKQLGMPTNPGEWQTFNRVWEKNTQRATAVKYDAPWFGSNSFKVGADTSGGAQPNTAGLPPEVAGAMRLRPQPMRPNLGQMPANLGITPVAGAPNTGNPIETAASQLSPDDQQAIATYLATLKPAGAGKPPQ